MDCFACRKYFEVLQRCVWTQTTQDFSFYKFSFLCKGRRVLGSNATYPIILPWCAETIWNWRVKHARKKTPYPHTYIYISTIVLGMNGPTQTASLLQEASNSHTSTSISHFALSCASCSTLLHIAPPIVSEISLLFRSFQIYWASQKALLYAFVTSNMLHRLHLKSFFKRISCDRSFGRVMPTYFHFSAFFGSGLGSLQERFSQSSPFLTTNSP